MNSFQYVYVWQALILLPYFKDIFYRESKDVPSLSFTLFFCHPYIQNVHLPLWVLLRFTFDH